jgi:hypothetical protein
LNKVKKDICLMNILRACYRQTFWTPCIWTWLTSLSIGCPENPRSDPNFNPQSTWGSESYFIREHALHHS